MKMLPLTIALWLATASVQARAQEHQGHDAAPPSQSRSTVLQGHEIPVTVSWGQPAVLPNIADYLVTIADLDKNADKVLTRNEVPATHALSSEFKLVDRNRDGRITEQELASWR